MSASANIVILMGNCTRDPQVKMVGADRAVANFGIAINERYKDKDGQQKESTTFVDCEAWGRTAELIGQYVTKGKAVHVTGRLKLDSWEKDGQKHSKLKVVVDNIQFLGGRGGDGEAAAAPAPAPARSAAPSGPKIPSPVADDDSDPPF